MDDSLAGDTVGLDWQRVLDTLADPIVAADVSGHILYVNQATERLLGWTAAELRGQPLTVLQPERFHALHLAGFQRFIATGESRIMGHPVRVPALHRDGGEVDIELSLSAIPTATSQIIVASLRDLRDRVELERQLAVTGYLRALTVATSRLTSMLDFEQVVQTVVSTLLESFEAVLARIWTVDPSSQMLTLRAEAGSVDLPSDAQSTELQTETLPVWLDEVARGKSLFLSNDLIADPRFDNTWLRDAGITSAAAFPLLIGEELQGIMTLFGQHPFSGELIDVLTNFAALVTSSLNDVRRFMREQEARADAEEARHRFAFLAEASRVLANAHDFEATLERVAHLTVPALADWCLIDLLDDDGSIRRVAVLHTERVDESTWETSALDVAQAQSIGRVLRSGLPELQRDLREESPAPQQGAQLVSSLCVPLISQGRTRGAISLLTSVSGRRYGAADLALVEDLARRAAIAIDNAALYRELRAAIRTRDDFLATVSHDLRNPIATLKGRAQVLLRRIGRLPVEERENFQRYLESIDATSDKMNRLISELVDMAHRRTDQPVILQRGSVDLLALTRQVVVEQGQGATRHQISVVCALPELRGRWDEMRLERVLTNLLANAIKYSPEGGPVELALERVVRADGDWAVVRVRDEGMGIPAMDLPRVFERFFRAGNVGMRITGSGIGLAGARQVVEQHGGRITVESVEGSGSVFTVELPIEPGGAS